MVELTFLLNQETKVKTVVLAVVVEEMDFQEMVEEQVILLQQVHLKEPMVEVHPREVGTVVAVEEVQLQRVLMEVVVVLTLVLSLQEMVEMEQQQILQDLPLQELVVAVVQTLETLTLHEQEMVDQVVAETEVLHKDQSQEEQIRLLQILVAVAVVIMEIQVLLELEVQV